MYLLDIGHSSKNIVFSGDSAGGGLSLSLALAIKEMGLPMPAGLVGMSPWVDLSHMMPSFDFNGITDYLPSRSLDPMLLEEGKSHYYAPNDLLRNKFVSP